MYVCLVLKKVSVNRAEASPATAKQVQFPCVMKCQSMYNALYVHVHENVILNNDQDSYI